MAKRKEMALFEAISKTQAKPGGQVLPPHVGIQPKAAKAEPRVVLYDASAEGGATAEPDAAPPPPPPNATRGLWAPADKTSAPPNQAGLYAPASGGATASPASGTVPTASAAASGYVPAASGTMSATGRTPESLLTPAVVKPAKTSAAPRPTGGVPMSRAAMSGPPTTRNDAAFAWSKPRLIALVLAAVLVTGVIWFLAVRSGAGPTSSATDGSAQAGLGASEALPPPPPEFQPGKWYLVVEDTRGATAEHKKDAEAIAAWLTQQNVPATAMHNDRDNRWVVVAYQPFDEQPYRMVNGKSVYAAEATAFAKKIEGLGKEYLRQSRKYQFKQTNPKGEFTPSYVRVSG